MNRTLPFRASHTFQPQPIRIIHTLCNCGTPVRVEAKKPPQRAVCASCLLTAQETALYPLEVNRDGTVRHSRLCTEAFGRYDLHCHRCLQLRDGAARRGWSPRKEPLGQRRLTL